MNKTDLVNSVLDKVRFKKKGRDRQRVLFPEFEYEPLPRKRATHVVNALFEIITNALENGEHVRIPGFGRFFVRFKWARKGRNPKTGEPIILDSRRIVIFHCSPRMKNRMRGTPSPGPLE